METVDSFDQLPTSLLDFSRLGRGHAGLNGPKTVHKTAPRRQNPSPHRFYSNLIPELHSQIFKSDANTSRDAAAAGADAGGRARRDVRLFWPRRPPVGLTHRPDGTSGWWWSKVVRFCCQIIDAHSSVSPHPTLFVGVRTGSGRKYGDSVGAWGRSPLFRRVCAVGWRKFGKFASTRRVRYGFLLFEHFFFIKSHFIGRYRRFRTYISFSKHLKFKQRLKTFKL